MNKFILRFIVGPLAILMEVILIINFIKSQLLEFGIVSIFVVLLMLIIFLYDGLEHIKYGGFEIQKNKNGPVPEELFQSNKSINPKIDTREEPTTIEVEKK